jgi:hypothetical protein
MATPRLLREPRRQTAHASGVISSLLLLASALVLACHPAAQARDTSPSPVRGPTTVEVENRGFPDMTVYVLDGARRERLGLASGHSTTSFIIPDRLVRAGSTLKFICDPIGDRALPVTEEILVQPGDVVSLIILQH